MREPAYLTIADDGRLTLFWGDGSEPEKIALLRGPRPIDGQTLMQIIEEMTAWAQAQGYRVVVPPRDLVIPPVELSISEEEYLAYDEDDMLNLLDDLDAAGDSSNHNYDVR